MPRPFTDASLERRLERDREILRLIREGSTARDVAARFDRTPTRVRQIVRAATAAEGASIEAC